MGIWANLSSSFSFSSSSSSSSLPVPSPRLHSITLRTCPRRDKDILLHEIRPNEVSWEPRMFLNENWTDDSERNRVARPSSFPFFPFFPSFPSFAESVLWISFGIWRIPGHDFHASLLLIANQPISINGWKSERRLKISHRLPEDAARWLSSWFSTRLIYWAEREGDWRGSIRVPSSLGVVDCEGEGGDRCDGRHLRKTDDDLYGRLLCTWRQPQTVLSDAVRATLRHHTFIHYGYSFIHPCRYLCICLSVYICLSLCIFVCLSCLSSHVHQLARSFCGRLDGCPMLGHKVTQFPMIIVWK